MSNSKHVFRLIFSRRIFPKAEYKALHKRTLKIHSSEIFSSVPEDLSFIPVVKSRQLKYKEARTTFIIDSFPINHELERTSLLFLNPSKDKVPVYLFNILQEDNQNHFFLNYSDNKKKIGEPQRDDFYLFTAEPGKSYMFYINGYFDRGESGSKTRTYVEHACFIQYFGALEIPSTTKRSGLNKVNIDLEKATVIDQRKLFY